MIASSAQVPNSRRQLGTIPLGRSSTHRSDGVVDKNSTNTTALAKLALQTMMEIEASGPTNFHVLIACAKSKQAYRDLARNMYISPLYRKSVMVAEGWGLPLSILSAKYGLLRPDEIIEPYDVTLKGASKQFKAEWAAKVDAQLRTSINPGKRLFVLAGDDYFQPLLEANPGRGPCYFTPMHGLSLGNRLAFLNQCIHLQRRLQAISRSYQLFSEIAALQGLHRLRDLLGEDLPRQGVYFFFDDEESTKFSSSVPRLVRVGTHGVSLGSTATLRTRLRTHLGTKSGAGNHRASVFRLHVGRAIIERDRLDELYPNWGKGQTAPKAVTELEAPLESKVSEYIGNLRVLFVPVAGIAGTGSMRATIESQFIGMFTENMCAIETGSSSWLGRFSDKPTIRESGLWNVRDVGSPYDARFIPLIENLLQKDILAERRAS